MLLRDCLWKHNLIHLKKAKTEIIASTECSKIVIRKNETETLSVPMYRASKKMKLSYGGDLCESKGGRKEGNLDVVDMKSISSGCQVKNMYDNDITHEYFSKNASMNNNENGVINLIGKAVLGSINGHRHLDPDDVLLHLFMAKFTSTLTIDQNISLTLFYR